MIVFINSFDLPIIPEIVKDLAERYEAGGVVDMHKIAVRERFRTVNGIKPDIIFDETCQLVASGKKHGKKHFVVNYTFDTPDTLRQLRLLLDRYDNEIYALRLNFSPTAFTKLTASFDMPDAVFRAYSAWREKQEEGARYGDMGYEIIVNSTDPIETINAIWDDIHEPVELVPYQENWPEMFSHAKEDIINALNSRIIDVEHIGSTAIPQMTAKPVIDILITIEHLQDARKCIQPLRKLGYAFIDYPQNTDRLFFRKGKPRSHHVHIVEKGSASELNHIHFRDALLSETTLRNEYLQLKQEALGKYKYRRALYGERKSELIKKTLEKFRKYIQKSQPANSANERE